MCFEAIKRHKYNFEIQHFNEKNHVTVGGGYQDVVRYQSSNEYNPILFILLPNPQPSKYVLLFFKSKQKHDFTTNHINIVSLLIKTNVC